MTIPIDPGGSKEFDPFQIREAGDAAQFQKFLTEREVAERQKKEREQSELRQTLRRVPSQRASNAEEAAFQEFLDEEITLKDAKEELPHAKGKKPSQKREAPKEIKNVQKSELEEIEPVEETGSREEGEGEQEPHSLERPSLLKTAFKQSPTREAAKRTQGPSFDFASVKGSKSTSPFDLYSEPVHKKPEKVEKKTEGSKEPLESKKPAEREKIPLLKQEEGAPNLIKESMAPFELQAAKMAPVEKRDNEEIEELAAQILKNAEVLKKGDVRTTTISINLEKSSFHQCEVTLTTHKFSPLELNISFRNLTHKARSLLNKKSDELKSGLLEKKLKVHQIITESDFHDKTV